MTRISIWLLSAALIFSACSSDPCGADKTAFLKNQTEFVKQVRAKKPEKWESADLQFRKFVKDCYPKYQTELSASEQGEFLLNSARYLYARYGKDFMKHLGEMNELRKQLEESFDPIKLIQIVLE